MYFLFCLFIVVDVTHHGVGWRPLQAGINAGHRALWAAPVCERSKGWRFLGQRQGKALLR
jgi:hypothetical protein